MTEEIVKKLEKQGYDADKELALRTYEELNGSIRHFLDVALVIQGLLIAILAVPNLDVRILALAFGGFEVVSMLVFRSMFLTKRLKIRVTQLIAQDPPMNDEYYDVVVLGFLIALTSTAMVLRFLGLL